MHRSAHATGDRRVPTGIGRRTAAVAGVLCCLSACTQDPTAGGPTPGTDGVDRGSPAPTSTVPARPPTRITMAFGGDVHFESHLAPIGRDPHGLDELRDTLGAADFSMVNLETSITERGTPIPGKAFTFRAPESVLQTLDSAGVDAVSMAMNHAVDYGDEGLADTLAAKDRSPVDIVGIGRDDTEAYAPLTVDVKGVKVAVLAASQVVEETYQLYAAGPGRPGIATSVDPARLLDQARRAEQTHDVVVAYLHWGVEGSTCPGDEAVERAQQLADAGVDVIIGDHAHRVNGSGWLDDAYVAYGMGNFVWYAGYEPANHTGVLTVTLDVPGSDDPAGPRRPLVTEADFQPMLIGGDGIPRIPAPAEQDRLRALYEAARACTPARPTADR